MNNTERLINELGSDAEFIGKADEEKIKFIERVLNVTLPDGFKWFLREFGLAVIPGFTILGNGLDTIPACVESTLDWRNYGLPSSFVVIEDSGTDWIYCLDTYRMSNYECPVIDWAHGGEVGIEYYETFLDFFEARLKEALELR